MTYRLVRWSLFLSEFNFVIDYRPGAANGKPDCISRRPDYQPSKESTDIDFKVLKPENFCAIVSTITNLNDSILSEYKNDPFYMEVCDHLSDNSTSTNFDTKHFTINNSFLLFDNRIYVPPNCRSSILNICHDAPSSGHFGINKTINLVKRDFWWPSLVSNVKKYVRSCTICYRSKDFRHMSRR